MRRGVKKCFFDLKHKISQSKYIETNLGPHATSETLLPVTLFKRLKAIRKSPEDANSDVAGFDNGRLVI